MSVLSRRVTMNSKAPVCWIQDPDRESWRGEGGEKSLQWVVSVYGSGIAEVIFAGGREDAESSQEQVLQKAREVEGA